MQYRCWPRPDQASGRQDRPITVTMVTESAHRAGRLKAAAAGGRQNRSPRGRILVFGMRTWTTDAGSMDLREGAMRSP